MQFAATNFSTPNGVAASAAGTAAIIAAHTTAAKPATIPVNQPRNLNLIPSSSVMLGSKPALCSKQCLCRQLSSTRIDAVSVAERSVGHAEPGYVVPRNQRSGGYRG